MKNNKVEPKLIQKYSLDCPKAGKKTYYCQLYAGLLCVSLGKSSIDFEQAYQNSKRNYRRSLKRSEQS